MAAVFERLQQRVWLWPRGLGLATLTMAVAQLLTHALNYAFQIAVGRNVPVGVYGEFQGLLSWLAIVTLPSGAVSLLISRRVAEARGAGIEADAQALLRRLLRAWLGLAGAVMLLAVWARHPLAHLFAVPDPAAAVAFVGLCVSTLLFQLATAFLLGKAAYQGLNLLNCGQSLLRLACAVVVVMGLGATSLTWATQGWLAAWWQQHPTAALFWAQVVSVLVASALALRSVWSTSAGPVSGSERTATVRNQGGNDLLLTTSAQLSLAFLMHVDMLYATRWLPGAMEAGYAGISMLAKVAIYVPTTVATIVFPQAAASRCPAEARQLARYALWVAGGLSVLCLLVTSSAPRLLLKTLLGPSYVDAAPWLPLTVAALTPAALLNVTLLIAVARRQRRLLRGMVVAVGAALLGLTLVPASLSALLGVLAAVATLGLLWSLWGLFGVATDGA